MKASIALFSLFVALAKASCSSCAAEEVKVEVEIGRSDEGSCGASDAAPPWTYQLTPLVHSHAVPFLRAYQPTALDHFYTTDANEMANAVNKLGYNREGVAAYVFTTQAPSTIPLYRMYNGGVVDHLYTTSWSEVESAAAKSGYTYEGVAAYVYSTDVSGNIPLYRMYSSLATDHFYTTAAWETSYASANPQFAYKMEGIAAYVLPVPN
ncbi:hypothetical protein M405DRAFT_930719 [Rhizopogon salebrosus TDB-379]|nr:hypothetical protein M405DRAFT_930719 [Rhizopogon salebrosus TDB-379]